MTSSAANNGGFIWGPESIRLIDAMRASLSSVTTTPDDDIARVRQDAGRVFSRCVPATGAAGQDSQLVVGRVQAGKTSNFTVVTGLARDNGYQLFIVLAGTKTELKGQTQQRLEESLGSLTA